MKFRVFMLVLVGLLCGSSFAAIGDEQAQPTPAALLAEEHRIVVVMLDVLDRMAAEAEITGRVDSDAAAQALEFLRGFVDECHHSKEEEHLFPAILTFSTAADSAQVISLLQQHDLGRALVKEMRAQTAAADTTSAEKFAAAARAYARLLREHIVTEDSVVFSNATSRFSAEQQTALVAEFDQIEQEEMGAGTHEKFHAIAETLAGQYLKDDEQAAGGCEHHH